MKKPLVAGAMFLLVISNSFAQAVPDASTSSQPLPDSAVVAERGGAVLTVGDMRAKLRTALPADKRRGFFTDGARVAAMVDDLLGTRQIAAAARQNGLDKDPELRAEVEAYELELLARREILRYLASRDEPNYEILARERYLANKASYAAPEMRDVRHILIRMPVEGRTEQEAMAIAAKAYDLLEAGGNFDEVYDEYAEDSNVDLKGWVRDVSFNSGLDPAFAEVAFSLQASGEISKPVRSSFGYHIIQLEVIKPGHDRSYDDVKDQLVDEIRRETRMAARTHYVESFTSQPLKLDEETVKQLPTQE